MDPPAPIPSSPSADADIASASTSTSTSTSSTSSASASSGSSASTIVLNKYELGRVLGYGSFAKVYHSRSLRDGSYVAIKVIDKSKTDPAMAPLIISEISVMRRLRHPNVIRIHEVLATKTKIYLVMELASGGDLFEKMKRRPDHLLPERMARRYFHQIVSAVRFCHMNGIAHRDIKPQNVLLDLNGNVKVSDFGLSRDVSGSDSGFLLKTACGTPAFAAPEVLCGKKRMYNGSKADAWSCGVLLYAMLAGQLPFNDENLAVMYRKTYKREFGFPSHVTRPARVLIYQLLDPNPNTRLTMEEIAKDPWFKAGQFGPRSMSLGDMVSLDENDTSERVTSMNAFDIIGMNSGVNLSRMFDDGIGEKQRRFTSKSPAEDVRDRVVEMGDKLGYEVEMGKGGKILLGREKLVLVAEVLQIGPELLVELKVVQGGGNSHWVEIRTELGDLVSSWHCVGP